MYQIKEDQFDYMVHREIFLEKCESPFIFDGKWTINNYKMSDGV